MGLPLCSPLSYSGSQSLAATVLMDLEELNPSTTDSSLEDPSPRTQALSSQRLPLLCPPLLPKRWGTEQLLLSKKMSSRPSRVASGGTPHPSLHLMSGTLLSPHASHTTGLPETILAPSPLLPPTCMMGTSDKPGPHACSTCRRQRPETLRAGEGGKPLPVSSLPKGEPEGSRIPLTIPGGTGGLPGGLNGPIADHMEQGADSPYPHIALGGPA